jgi:hypothetical protein
VIESGFLAIDRKKIRNPNIENRNKLRPNQIQNRKIQNTKTEGVSFGILCFSHLKLFRISDFVLRIFCPLPIGLPTLRPEQRPESAAVGDFLDPPRSVDKAKEGKFIAQAKTFRHRFSRDGYNGRISSPQRLFLGHLYFYSNSRKE